MTRLLRLFTLMPPNTDSDQPLNPEVGKKVAAAAAAQVTADTAQETADAYRKSAVEAVTESTGPKDEESAGDVRVKAEIMMEDTIQSLKQLTAPKPEKE